MTKLKKLLMIITLSVIILASLYIYTLTKIKLESASVNSLTNVTTSGFTLKGAIELYNGGLLPAKIPRFKYKLILASSNEEIVNGYVNTEIIMPRQSKKFSFSTRVSWIPTAKTAWELISNDKTYAYVKGNIHLLSFCNKDLDIPFKIKVNLKKYVEQFVNDELDKIGKAINNVIHNITG